jgi:hypothetical protein
MVARKVCRRRRRFNYLPEPHTASGCAEEIITAATVDRVARVQRPTVEADIGVIAARLHETLGAVVTRLAQRLERPEPELVDITVVRLDVIVDGRRLDDPALEGELGVDLFLREKRRVYLTQAGEELLARARLILGAAHEAGVAVRVVDSGNS